MIFPAVPTLLNHETMTPYKQMIIESYYKNLIFNFIDNATAYPSDKNLIGQLQYVPHTQQYIKVILGKIQDMKYKSLIQEE